MIKNIIFLTFQHIAPQHLISRFVAYFANSKTHIIKSFFIEKFAKKYQVNMQEAEEESLAEYATFNDFFTRALKKDARPFDKNGAVIISPADGVISASGEIKDDNKILQAKGRYFTIDALLGNKDKTDKHSYDSFMTIYLSPKDYHRVHMPCDGELTKMSYIPGDLFSVNQTTADSVNNLFARNERLVCHFSTASGDMVVVLVGAMIVAGIETSWAGKIAPVKKQILNWDNNKVSLKKGDELGRFYLGSTVIMLFSDAIKINEDLTDNPAIQMGNPIATSKK